MSEPRDPHDIERLEELARFPEENPNPVLRVTPEGTVLYANDAARQVAGLLTGRKHEKLAKNLVQDVAMAVSDETVRNVEFESSGATYNFALVPVTNRRYVNLFGSNISKRKRMEQSARENEELLTTILDNSPMMIALRDTEGRFQLINRRYEEFHEVAKDDVVGKTLHDIFPKKEADNIGTGDSEVIVTGEGCVNEETYVLDDREVVLSAVKFPIRDLSGNVTGVGIIDVDVTESRHAEEKLARQEFEARLLLRITEITTNNKSWGGALKQSMEVICETTGWPVGHVYRVEDDGQRLKSAGFWHLDDPEGHAAFKKITERTILTRGEGLPGRILESGKPAWITNVQTDPNFPRGEHAVDIGVRGAFGFPVVMDGNTLAVLEFFSNNELSPDETLLTTMGRIGVEIGRVFRRRDAELQLEEKEAQLRIALENIPGALVYTDEALNIVICNDRFAQIYQVPKELLLPGRPYPDFLRHLAERGYYGEGDVDELVARRVESLRNPTDESLVDIMPDGSIHEVRRRAATGGTVTVITDITERKRSEEALAREKQILNMTLESIDQGISMFDADLRLMSFNEKFLEILDLPADLIKVGTSLEEAFRYNAERGDYGPGHIEEQVRERLELARSFEPHQFERTRPDGTVLEIRGEPTAGGGFVTTYTDITKRRRAEEKLRKSERRQARILEALSEGIYEWDIEKDTLYLSSTLAELLGLPDDALGPDDWNALIHPDDFEKYRQALRTNFKGQTGRLECEYRVRRENGEYRWLSDRGIPVRNDAGRAVKLVGAVRDITDRKLAARRIEETEMQMRMALETLPGGLVYTDADLNVVVSNKKFAEMHNAPGELLSPGEPYTGFLRYLAEHGYYGEGDLDAFVAQRVEAIRNPLDTTVDHRTPEGRIHEIRRRKVPGGGTVSVVTDVTEEKQAAEEISRQAHMLREMSTPITQIRSGTLLLPLVGLIDSRRAHDVLNAVLDKIAATRAKVLILDISGVSFVDSAVANHLIKITRGTRLMGCDCIISGVSFAIAQTIVELGIDIEDIETTANLAQAIKDQELSFS